MKRSTFLAITTAITALAFLLRIWHLGAHSLWMDEGASIGFARMSWHEFFRVLSLREANMSLYYLFLRGWAALGDSEFFLRLPSVIFGTAAIAVFVIFANRMLGRTVAVIAGLLLAVSALDIRYTRELRSYGLVLLLLAVSWVLYERAARDGKWRSVLLWALVSTLAIYAHFFSALVIASQVACLLFAGLTRERIVRFIAGCVFIAVLVLPLIFFMMNTKANPLSWVPPLSMTALQIFAADFANGGTALITISFLLLLTATAMLFRAPAQERWPLSIAVIGTLLPITLTALMSLHQPAFLSRYLIVALPNFTLAVAVPLARIPRTAAALTVLGIVAMTVPTLVTFYRTPVWNDFRGAATYIAEHAQPGDALIVWEPLGRPAMDYYSHRFGKEFPVIVFPGAPGELHATDIDIKPDVASIDQISEAYPRVWLVYTSAALPQDYTVWMTFFARRMSLHHRLAGHFQPEGTGTQVLEYVRP